MSHFELSPNYISMKKNGKITITSVDPTDNEYLEIEDSAAEMFQLLVEQSKTVSETISLLSAQYPDVETSVIEADLNALVEYLLEKKVITKVA